MFFGILCDDLNSKTSFVMTEHCDSLSGVNSHSFFLLLEKLLFFFQPFSPCQVTSFSSRRLLICHHAVRFGSPTLEFLLSSPYLEAVHLRTAKCLMIPAALLLNQVHRSDCLYAVGCYE